VQILAAQYAVDVTDSHLDFAGATFLNFFERWVNFDSGHVAIL
jgi:hypothetical protein